MCSGNVAFAQGERVRAIPGHCLLRPAAAGTTAFPRHAGLRGARRDEGTTEGEMKTQRLAQRRPFGGWLEKWLFERGGTSRNQDARGILEIY